MQPHPHDIRELTEDELKGFFTRKGEKAFHGKQVYEWLWKKGAVDFQRMSNLSKASRKLLEEHFSIPALTLAQEQTSADGTLKMVFRTADGMPIESVLIPSGPRATACISSQVGCKLACTFCATGQIPFQRNLTLGEIYDQVVALWRKAEGKYGLSLSNIVYMGMGEPLLNYEHVAGSVHMISGGKGLGMSPRRLTISTVGIPGGIRKLADDGLRSELAVSLHSAIDEVRTRLVPVSKKFDLQNLKEALQYFTRKTGKRITFEYLLLKDVNDRISDARALAEYSRNFPVKINLIEYNEVEGSGFYRSEARQTEDFKAFLEERNMIVNIRRSRGQDIDAACGQLAGKKGK